MFVHFRFNITTGTYPFSGANIYLLLENISTQTVTIPSDLAPQLQTLLEGMLEKNPIHRFSISQVKSHRSDLLCLAVISPFLLSTHRCTDILNYSADDQFPESFENTPFLLLSISVPIQEAFRNFVLNSGNLCFFALFRTTFSTWKVFSGKTGYRKRPCHSITHGSKTAPLCRECLCLF